MALVPLPIKMSPVAISVPSVPFRLSEPKVKTCDPGKTHQVLSSCNLNIRMKMTRHKLWGKLSHSDRHMTDKGNINSCLC